MPRSARSRPSFRPTAKRPYAAGEAPDVLELPELGLAAAGMEAPVLQWADEADAAGAEGAEVIEFAPVGAAPAAGGAHDEAPPPRSTSPSATSRCRRISISVLVDEAQAHLATLERGLSLLQSDPNRRPSAEMVRASHTLCGIHRTCGLPLIALPAKALEQCLLALQPLTGSLPDGALAVLTGSTRGIADLVGRVKARIGFSAIDAAGAEEIRQELELLRRTAIAASDAPEIGDAEAQAERESIGADSETAYHAPAMEGATPQPPATPAPEAVLPAATGSPDPRPRRHPLRPAPDRKSPPCVPRRRQRRPCRQRPRNPRTPKRRRIRWPTSATTSTSRCCRSSSTRRRSSIRRPASRSADGAAPPPIRPARGSCGARCTR